jgi:hypothetical protein
MIRPSAALLPRAAALRAPRHAAALSARSRQHRDTVCNAMPCRL